MGIGAYLIDGAEILLAHTAKKGTGKEPESLIEHSNLVLHYVDKLSEHNGLSSAIQRAVANLTVQDEPLTLAAQYWVVKCFRQAIYLHDLGKINPVFQKKKMGNQQIEKLSLPGDSNHALLSALLYLDIHLAELDEIEFPGANSLVGNFMKQVLYVFAYVISRHHTYLANIEEPDGEETSFEKQLQLLQKKIQRYPGYVHYYRYKERLCSREIIAEMLKSRYQRFTDTHSPFPFYVLAKLLYSTMAACDFYATYAYDAERSLEFQYFSKKQELRPVLEAFHNTEIYRGVQELRNNPQTTTLSPINRLRSALFLATEAELLRNLDKQLYYLEAPTGSGKTYMSINLGLKLLNSELGLNKLIYVFPFNALIEQTKLTLDKIFPDELRNQYPMPVINSITPIISKKEEAAETGNGETEPDFDYKSVLLQRQMLQYPVMLTSHVNFFNYLFGLGRESNLAFTHLCNSVVILDEIQSYKNAIWKEIIHFLQSFAKLLNMKIIIMSATLPNWDLLVAGESDTCSLVTEREQYFQNPLFRNRVQLHFELLEKKVITEEELLAEVLKKLKDRQAQGKSTRLLIEFITKGAARSFYRCLQSAKLDIPLFELTGDDSNLLRKEVLKQLSKDEKDNFYLPNAIVVATQVIEAGVDIDMDIGFKDSSMLDSEEQFLGRINRSCLRPDCHAYFFNMVKTTLIYRADQRTAYDLQDEGCQKMLQDKDFSGFYHLIMEKINAERQKANLKNWSYFTASVQQLQFKEVEEAMRLITEKQYTLFIAHAVAYKNEDGEAEQLDGAQVWEKFKVLLADREMEYAERIVKLSQIKEKMAYFTFNYGIQHSGKQTPPQFYTEVVGTLYYVPDGERFMELDKNTGAKKFNRQAYIGEEVSPLL
ncbi:CRISPR-associated helicase Cas3' [Sporomusa sp. KB1]|uniref:CRISPR-associated helicase Cas3' n=1 Tax=Sporomusa sp. KB1 TaxID=943346 RepID=UPI0011A625D9|nr:CRISPR-associated helicase Cas3' [Sporomusa sp. KB1]TWH48782.1 CRISPR-associated endonuclease/helicase Cas3 [Sporomusa sp. KB1]